MGWEDFNLNLMEAFDFSLNAQNVVLRVFESANEALTDEWNKYLDDFKKKRTTPLEEWEADFQSQEKDWEEDLHRQRMQGVGALALDWLMSSLQSALHSTKKYLDSTHPDKPPYNKKEGWLGCVTDEYKKRFGIDLTAGPVSFGRVQELVLARNAGIHRDKGNLETYRRKINKPAFVDGEDQFYVTHEALSHMIQDCEAFLKCVVSEIEKLRPASPAKTKSASKPPTS